MTTPDHIGYTSISLVIFGDFFRHLHQLVDVRHWLGVLDGGGRLVSVKLLYVRDPLFNHLCFILEYINNKIGADFDTKMCFNLSKILRKNLGLRSWLYTKYLIKSFHSSAATCGEECLYVTASVCKAVFLTALYPSPRSVDILLLLHHLPFLFLIVPLL